MGVGFVAGVFGGLLLAHAAYATIQYRSVLKIVEEEFSGPPMNVVAELLLGLALCMWAGLAVPGKFLSILPDSDENSWYVYNVNLCYMDSSLRVRYRCRTCIDTGSGLFPYQPIWTS